MEFNKITTPEDLFKLLSSQYQERDERTRPLRYVVYLRKSTDDNENQKHSLEDQRASCLEMIERERLLVVDPTRDILEEKKSAKEADKRPVFRQMLNDVQAGKYDGIISWHPNRLARNMKDAGEIIDLLDKGVIKPLEFPTFQFQNNAMGKMTLGLTFVLSKQYSDNLSESVNRGNQGRIQEGKYINKTKHGYYKDADGFLRPDGRNFDLIKQAFQMRLQEETLDNVAKFLNDNNYTRTNVKTGNVYSHGATKQSVQKILREPVYAGVSVYGKTVTDLTSIYNFEPAVSVANFMEINKLDKKSKLFKLAKSYRKNEKITADLLRGHVFCSECGESKSATATPKKDKKTGKTKRYFYFRCETDGCIYKNRGTRAKVILGFVDDYLSKNPFSSKEAFEHCKKELRSVARKHAQELQNKLTGTQRRKEAVLERIAIIKSNIALEQDIETRKIQLEEKEHNEKLLQDIDVEIIELEERIEANYVAPLQYGKFLELLEKSKQKIRKANNMKYLDYTLKKIFLNFTVTLKTVEKYTLQKPFDAFERLNETKVSNSAGGGT